MAIKNLVIVHLLIFLMGFGCKNSKGSLDSNASPQQQSDQYIAVAKDKLGGDIAYEKSPSATYVLCKKERGRTAQMPQNFIEYLVYDIKSEQIVLESSLDNGTIQWYTDHQLEIRMVPGIMAEGQTRDDYAYIYDLKTKKKVNKRKFMEDQE